MWDGSWISWYSSTNRVVSSGRFLAVVTLVPVALTACGDLGPDQMPEIDSTTVASADVIARIDPDRTYEYDRNTGRWDSVLTVLWSDGLPVDEAWWPLHYTCEDVRGPRLTVALEQADDSRMADLEFSLGTGRLLCSTDLRHYVIGDSAGSFRVDGTIRFIEVEGGCWALRANDSLQYEPLGLPSAFREDGLRVRARIRLVDDMSSICMIGRIAEVLRIETR